MDMEASTDRNDPTTATTALLFFLVDQVLLANVRTLQSIIRTSERRRHHFTYSLLPVTCVFPLFFSSVQIAGMLTSVLFTVLYVPQMLLNQRRRSTEGFSSHGIVIKLFGAAFLTVNSWSTGEALPVIAYGGLNVLQHSLFMAQFFLFERKNNLMYLGCIVIAPLIPYCLVTYYPASVAVTNYFKPLSQVFSIIPQLLECRRLRTAGGVSLLSQHLNFFGGVMGIYMCSIIPPKSFITWFLYLNSCGQAMSIYITYIWYDTQWLGSHRTVSSETDDPFGKDV